MSILLLCSVAKNISADTLIRMRFKIDSHTLAGHAIPSVDTASTIWISKDKVRVDQSTKLSLIHDSKTDIWIALYHAQKMFMKGTYHQLFTGRVNEDSAYEDFQEEVAALKPKIPARVEETDSEKTILGFKCRKYIMTMELPLGQYRAEIWASTEPRLDAELFMKFYHATSLNDPEQSVVMSETKKIRGIPLLTVKYFEAAGPGIRAIDEVVEIKEVKVPPGYFEVPKDYEKYMSVEKE